MLSLSRPITVGELTHLLKNVIDQEFHQIEVLGEISNFSRYSGGHCYLTLKDKHSQLPAVMWKSVASKLRFDVHDGLEVIAKGKVEVYVPHGKYQLIINQLEPKGIGSLELAFHQLKDKLSREGLFLPSSKKPIPRILRRIALVTSSTGAAIRDFLNILGRRTQRTEVVILPVTVQGDQAAPSIVHAFEQINRYHTLLNLDAVALIRGGGSAEDLWAFNEEPTVRAVAACHLPVVTGIGHEVDTSLCDLAADLHALTPSDAAVRMVLDDSELKGNVNELERRLHLTIDRLYQRIDQRIWQLQTAGVFQNPKQRIIDHREEKLTRLKKELAHQIERQIEKGEHQIERFSGRLDSLSPLKVLARGYSLTQLLSGEIVRSTEQVSPGQTIRTRLEQGIIESIVQERRIDQ